MTQVKKKVKATGETYYFVEDHNYDFQPEMKRYFATYDEAVEMAKSINPNYKPQYRARLTLDERKKLQELLELDITFVELVQRMDRNQMTIERELARIHPYDAEKAHLDAEKKCHSANIGVNKKKLQDQIDQINETLKTLMEKIDGKTTES